jgi:hypothetical protein
MMPEGEQAGHIGDVGQIGDQWAFTLYDYNDRELLAFLFVEEAR